MSIQTQIHISASISVAEFPLGPTGASHTYIIFDLGDEIIEMHGLATNRFGDPIPVGMPWDATDTISYWDTQSLRANGILPESRNHYLGIPQNTKTLFTGTVEEVQAKLEVARLAGHKVNAAGLDYMVLHQNSNSMTTGLLNAMGLPQPVYTFMTPGSALDLVDAAEDPERTGLLGRIGNSIDTALNKLGTIGDAVGDVIGGAFNTGGHLVSGAINAVRSVVSGLVMQRKVCHKETL